MRHVLELCLQMDQLAERTYRQMAEDCDDVSLATMFRHMGSEEAAHVEWWRRLLDAWEDGLVPDAFSDTVELEKHLESIYEEVTRLSDASATISCDSMLDLAVRMEFFMLDPIFGELLDLVEPARAAARHHAYANHIERIVRAVQERYGSDSLTGFLATVLRRTWRDNVELAGHATRDSLTGLHNRRSLDVQLRQWAAWSQRYHRPLAVVLVDVDDFKLVNDRYGHITGDRALQAVAGALTDAVRASDLVARYGGDEFAVVAPELEPDEFDTLCNRIVERVRALSLPTEDGQNVLLSVSVGGVVAAPRTDGFIARPEDLLAAADRGLYAAKRAGKDRASVPLLLDEPIAI